MRIAYHGAAEAKARVGQSLASIVLPRLPPWPSIAPDIDSELSEAENRESDTDSTTTSTCTSGDREVKSLMSVLRCPPLSVISRKRKLRANHPPTGKKRTCSRPCRGPSDPKSITPVQRVKEHPGESLSDELFVTCVVSWCFTVIISVYVRLL